MEQLRLVQDSLVLSLGGEFKVKVVFPYTRAAQIWVFGSGGASVHLNKSFPVDSKFAMLLVWE